MPPSVVHFLLLVLPTVAPDAAAVPESVPPSTAEAVLAKTLVETRFIENGWRELRTGELAETFKFGFLNCFISPEVRKTLKTAHGLAGSHALAEFESTRSKAFLAIFEAAGLSVEASDVLLLLYCRSPVLTWHIAATGSHLVVRSSAMAHAFWVRWDDILRFEASEGLPRHYTIHAQPESVSAAGQEIVRERYSALGPFEERLLLPRVVVGLLERSRADLTMLMRTSQEEPDEEAESIEDTEGQSHSSTMPSNDNERATCGAPTPEPAAALGEAAAESENGAASADADARDGEKAKDEL